LGQDEFLMFTRQILKSLNTPKSQEMLLFILRST
jgi:hypothetical protein